MSEKHQIKDRNKLDRNTVYRVENQKRMPLLNKTVSAKLLDSYEDSTNKSIFLLLFVLRFVYCWTVTAHVLYKEDNSKNWNNMPLVYNKINNVFSQPIYV